MPAVASSVDFVAHVYLSGEQVRVPIKLERNGFTFYKIPDAILLSPGIHNGNYYSAEAIAKAFQLTDWDNPKVRDLYVDHKDNEVPAWVGRVENIRFDGENLIGDLYISDDSLAKKLALGAKFGISPKLRGKSEAGEMKEFVFENFSIVVNPACKTTFLNSEQKEGDAKMEEEIKKEEEQEQPAEEQPKEEQPAEEQPSELSEEEALKEIEDIIEELKSKYIKFVEKYIEEHPGATIKDAAKAWREKYPKAYKDSEEMEDEISLLEKVLEMLKKKKEKYPYPEEDSEDELKKKKKKEYPYPYKDSELEAKIEAQKKVIEELSEKVKELEAKLKEPEVKSQPVQEAKSPLNTDMAVLELLRKAQQGLTG